MVNFYCDRCGYTTTHKQTFRNHLFRKITCISTYNNISINQLAKKYNIKNSEHNREHNRECNTKRFKCNFCNKMFSTSTSRYRHQRKYCKYKPQETKIDKIIKKNKELTIKNKNMIKIFKQIKSQCENNNINNNKIISNCKINKNTQINNTQNNNQQVKINNFGKEDISYITPERRKQLLIDPRNSIANLIDDTHFNSDHPENANIRIPNKKQPFVELYIDDTWKVFNQYRTICKILQDKQNIIHDIFIKEQHELTKEQKEKYLNYKEHITRDLFLVKQILTDIRASIISGTRNNPKIKEYQNKLKDNRNPIMKLLEQIPEDFLYENDNDNDENTNDIDNDIDNDRIKNC